MQRKIFRYGVRLILGLLACIVLFIAVSVIPIDYTPYNERDAYREMQKQLAILKGLDIPKASYGFRTGYAKENITPYYKTSLAGSGPNKPAYASIHDSIFVRVIVIDNGGKTVALVTADLLLIPPTVAEVLQKKLTAIDFSYENVYLSATHTHSSVGNWGEHLAGRIYSGVYSDTLVQFLANKIVECIESARINLVPSVIKEGTIPTHGILFNRLADDKGDVDSLLRVMEIQRADSTKMMLVTYTGHATCASSDNFELSRDYPGVLVDQLETGHYDFAMFMAGAVGSHGCKGGQRGWERVNLVGESLASTIITNSDQLRLVEDSTIMMVRVPLLLSEPQLKISQNWRIRPWLFNAVFGKYPASLTALRLGDVIMLGTPCDFSGELDAPIDSAAMKHGFHVMVTSFNGGYIGYITKDDWYDIDHYETRIMNWYGPGNGKYLTGSMIKLLEVMDGNEQTLE